MTMAVNPLNILIPPEIKDDPFYAVLMRIAADPGVKTILEIGASSGGGSTEALVAGIAANPSRPTLYSIEISIPRFAVLTHRYQGNPQFKPYNVSSVPPEKFPSEQHVAAFYQQTRTGLNNYPLGQVLSWLRADLDYIRTSGVPQDGIERIRRANGIDRFDMVLIDGSEFTGSIELELVLGAKWILMDDVNSFKCLHAYRRLLADPSYLLREANFSVRNGYAVFERIIFDGSGSIALESPQRMMLLRRLRRGAVTIDVGANVGDFSILLSRTSGPQGKVYALEPASSTFATLQRRLKEHGCQNVDTFQYAATSANGPVRLNEFDDQYAAWNSLGMPRMRKPENLSEMVSPTRSETVGGITLDTFCRERGISRVEFLKIDVEGAEADVLKGARDLLTGGRVPLVQFEISQEMLAGMKRSAREVFAVLESYGYECRRVREDGSFGEVVSDSQSYYENYAAIPKLPVQFFTIVYNGEPQIRRHRDQLERLPFSWQWHIFEGSEQPGLSTDGTTQYLDGIAKADGLGRVIVYRKQDALPWSGRIEMLNVLPQVIGSECLLWEIGFDSNWLAERIEAVRKMFLAHANRTAAVLERGVKIWRFRPGMQWANQLPPLLAEPIGQNQWRDVAAVNPFSFEDVQAAVNLAGG